MNLKTATFALIPLALPTSVMAEEEKAWQANAELGAIFTSGNTETTSIKAKLDVKQELESWSNHYVLDALFKEDEIETEIDGVVSEEKQTTAEKYFASLQANYKLESEGSSLFVFGSHTDDKFGGISKYTTIAAGYSRHLYKSDAALLKADIGPGYVFGEQADGTEIDSSIIRLAADYSLKVSENATFTQVVSVESSFEGEKNTRTKSETGFAAKINGSLQMKLGLVITNNSEVSVGTEKTDTETTVTLVYAF